MKIDEGIDAKGII
jgi:hypothetical protein